MRIIIAYKMPLTIALYGDSYISRLKYICECDLWVRANVCGFDKSDVRSYLINRKGEIDETANANYERLKKLRPDCAFINVGGNDLTTRSTPREVYKGILDLVDELKQVGVKVICVAEIMTRDVISKYPDSKMNNESFDLKGKKINSLLTKGLKERFVKFSDIRYPADYTTDPVHLLEFATATNNTGLNKYESRFHRADYAVLKLFNSDETGPFEGHVNILKDKFYNVNLNKRL